MVLNSTRSSSAKEKSWVAALLASDNILLANLDWQYSYANACGLRNMHQDKLEIP